MYKSKPAKLILENGKTFHGFAFGKIGTTIGEVCFNTGMTGYQEILTDPSYSNQIITFTFPHIGNVGVNKFDVESKKPAAKGLVIRENITKQSNFRATDSLQNWLIKNKLVGISGVDTRQITQILREKGSINAVISFNKNGKFNFKEITKQLKNWEGIKGCDLTRDVTRGKECSWNKTVWSKIEGYGYNDKKDYHIVAIDYGAKDNILRNLASLGCRVTVVPATTKAKDIFKLKPNGIFLSNGPGDPQATGKFAIQTIKEILKKKIPTFGICLGHQILAIALGGKTKKMHHGHRGANHPVLETKTGKVIITVQNHGFEVLENSLPKNVKISYKSLFDGSIEGLELTNNPVFSVQYHPEASPGPHDHLELFNKFYDLVKKNA